MNRIRAMQNGNILPGLDSGPHRQGRVRGRWLIFYVTIAAAVAGGDVEPTAADEGRAVARRLNRLEYQNTICDLLGVKIDFQEMLPPDSSAAIQRSKYLPKQQQTWRDHVVCCLWICSAISRTG